MEEIRLVSAANYSAASGSHQGANEARFDGFDPTSSNTTIGENDGVNQQLSLTILLFIISQMNLYRIKYSFELIVAHSSMDAPALQRAGTTFCDVPSRIPSHFSAILAWRAVLPLHMASAAVWLRMVLSSFRSRVAISPPTAIFRVAYVRD